MEKNPRYVEIDYAKYVPDIPEDQLEAYYGLPKHVQFCNECVMSNQKPNSCYEFEHTIKSIKKTMVIQDDGTCDACHACHNKANGNEIVSSLPGMKEQFWCHSASAAWVMDNSKFLIIELQPNYFG